MSIDHAPISSNRGDEIGTPEDEATAAYNNCVKGLEDLLLDEKEYAENISTYQTDQTITALHSKVAEQLKQKTWHWNRL